MSAMSGHVSSDRLGDAARHGGVDFLRDTERRHVLGCDQCQRLYGGYRLTDRLLAAPWRDVKLPPAAVARPSRLGALAEFMSGLNARSVAPAVAAIGIVTLIGAALALPQLMPAPPVATDHSPIASATTSPSASGPAATRVSPSSSAQPSSSPGAQASGPGGSAPSSPSGPTPGATAGGSAGNETLAIGKTGGSPIAWSPDGAHLLLWGSGSPRQLQIRDASGRLNGTAAADAAAWVTSSTIAIATHSSGVSPSASASGPGHHGVGVSPGRSGGGETVSIVDVGGHPVATLPGSYALGGGVANGMIVGSGSGEFTIASQGGSGSFGWSFVLWNGSVSAVQDGLPIAFSQDSHRLAVLHPSSVSGGVVTGWLEVMVVPSLNTVASFTHLNLRVGSGSLGSSYGFDAAFSPDGRYLLASGTLVNLSNGSPLATGKGGWLPDGTLVTSSNAGLLRWQGTHSSVDSRFPGMGTVETARHGELIYFYGDSRPALLLDTDGSLTAISLAGVRSIGGLLVSPNGRAIAFGGRATDGSSITAVATLP
ncbi:MAG: hypothetical protein ABSD62_04665 [Candidatus Limnocylindrales bacterium]|jgi:hypothetical protein